MQQPQWVSGGLCWLKEVSQNYILYDSIFVGFSKRQSYGDGRRSAIATGRDGGRSDLKEIA